MSTVANFCLIFLYPWLSTRLGQDSFIISPWIPVSRREPLWSVNMLELELHLVRKKKEKTFGLFFSSRLLLPREKNSHCLLTVSQLEERPSLSFQVLALRLYFLFWLNTKQNVNGIKKNQQGNNTLVCGTQSENYFLSTKFWYKCYSIWSEVWDFIQCLDLQLKP